jgi:hypothetical protein
MLRLSRWLALALVLAAPLAARAQTFCAPVVAPAVSYYAAPVVSYYTPAPVVSYYAPAPVVSYYAPAPTVSYYTPAAPVTVSTYRYGLFGRRSLTTVNYGGVPAVSYYTPSVYVPRRVSYYTPSVIVYP